MNEIDLLSRQLANLSLNVSNGASSHCRLMCGDIVGNYQIDQRLGKGRFATVWSARKQTTGDIVAIKIYRIGDENERYYANEVKILNCIFEYSIATQTIPPNIIGYLGTFAHIAIGHDKGPRIHPCVIFNIAGDSLSELLRFCRAEHGNSIPLPIVKKIMRELLAGLAYLHRCNIIHTDIKPSNILLNKRIENLDENDLTISLADLGSSTFADSIFSDRVGTTQYIAPELIIEMPYGTPADIWSAFTMCFELITGDLLFDVYSECDISYGDDIDYEAMEGLEYATGSDSSGSEDDLDEEKINYRHLLLISKVIGHPPREFARAGRTYYNRRNKLKNNPDIVPTTIGELLFSNYEMEPFECQSIEDFLMTGLKYLPEERITAEQALQHPFLR